MQIGKALNKNMYHCIILKIRKFHSPWLEFGLILLIKYENDKMV